MARICLGFVIALVLFCSFNQAAASTVPTACEDPSQWLSVFLPPEVIALVCSISETTDPFTVEPDGSNGSVLSGSNGIDLIQESNPPEEAKQELLLWFLLWTQR